MPGISSLVKPALRPPSPPPDHTRANNDINVLLETMDYLKQTAPDLNDDDIQLIIQDLAEMQKKRRAFEMATPRTVTLKAEDAKYTPSERFRR